MGDSKRRDGAISPCAGEGKAATDERRSPLLPASSSVFLASLVSFCSLATFLLLDSFLLFVAFSLLIPF
ncbi:hypothetical protein, partial [Slackia piriformis]|uniref:hypothetical protein n=1 Tax=Slackia piriformis TaxID=626934 RepID=UPI0023F54866